jgi:UDP-arabinose 4-epimerase
LVARRIFVTGGAGYIGSHCCKALAAAGFEPVVYDNLSTGHVDLVRWGPLIEGDVRDRAGLTRALKESRAAAVMHFAGAALVAQSVAGPGLYYDINVVGGLRLIEGMLASGIRRMVFSSTCAVYGIPAEIPISESCPLLPVNPYGASKLTFERMLSDFDVAHGLRAVCLRYFNAAGADPEGQLGEWHDNETHLVPLVLDAALGRHPAIRVFGTDYPTRDGTAVRDYIHVSDLAAAHVAALMHLLDGGGSDRINLGTGRGSSVREVIRAAESVVGQAIATRAEQRREGDPPELVADPTRAGAVLGWRARRSDLVGIIRDAWRWHSRESRIATPQPRFASSPA